MKRLFGFMLISILCASCITTSKVVHLTGNYDFVSTVETNKTYDEVWNKVVDYFATTGIPISTIEKASGLIISKEVSLKGMITMEKDGALLDENAFVVIPYASKVVYMNATSDFNVRVREVNGKVSITVNLPNIIAERTIKPTGFQLVSVPERVEAKSTGVFERGLLELFK